MKKVLVVIIALILVVSMSASADINLSDMSFEELKALQQQITLALWACDEWQEVEVPAGVYQIGKDIPAGKWTISPVSGGSLILVYGTKLDETGANIGMWDVICSELLYSKDSIWYPAGEPSNCTLILADGNYLILEDDTIFTIYVPATLGFK